MKMTNGDTVIECDLFTKNIWVRYGFKEVEDTEDELSYTELKSLAKEKGINTHGMKKDEIIEALK